METQERTKGITGRVIEEGDYVNEKATFKILIATDIHLGHQYDSLHRSQDSFRTFEEILEIAKSQEVDFVLLGGDLFDVNQPQIGIMNEATRILAKHVLGSKPQDFELISPAAESFGHTPSCINDIELPNWMLSWVNIGLPVLTVHGNHDNPVGEFSASAVDTLVSLGLVSHFGRIKNSSQAVISPVSLKKKNTIINIWGFGSVKDEKLNQLMQDGRVRFQVPTDVEEHFNILVLHQNRTKRGPSELSFYPEKNIPKFIDFVLWGHEHDNRISLEYCAAADCFISQPGSTVPTSLCEGESDQKHVGILSVNQNRFKFKPIPLETNRLVLFDTVNLFDLVDLAELEDYSEDVEQKIKNALHEEVEKRIEIAQEEHKKRPRAPRLPLIRIRLIVGHPRFESFNVARFATRYEGRVANTDIILFKRTHKKEGTQSVKAEEMDEKITKALLKDSNQQDIIKYVEHHFSSKVTKEDSLSVLSEVTLLSYANAIIDRRAEMGKTIGFKQMNNVVKCLTGEARNAILEKVINQPFGHLEDGDMENDIERYLEQFREEKIGDTEIDPKIMAEIEKESENGKVCDYHSADPSEDEVENTKKRQKSTTRGRGRGRGRGTGRTRAKV